MEDQGGWLNDSIVDAFEDYSRVVFTTFGDRVSQWLTFNEPYTFVRQGYSEGNHAPGRCSDRTRCTEGNSFTEPYLVAHNVLRSHARAVEVFRREVQPRFGGRVGITLNVDWAEPSSSAPEDVAAAEDYML